MKPAIDAEFRCPECGGSELDIASLDEPLDPSDPWSGLFPTVRCRQCETLLPAHLTNRKGGLSWQQAENEWRQLYRPNSEE